MKISTILYKLFSKIPVYSEIISIKHSLETIANHSTETGKILEVLIDNRLSRNLPVDPNYNDPLCLNLYERQVFSQSGEDGIIEEIFNRIGVTNQYFVEFGVGEGTENNTVYLLNKKWKGFWIEGNENNVKRIKENLHFFIDKRQLNVEHSFITAENIENLFEHNHVPFEFDLLSIDIDRNDYWVWKNINNYSPRLVVIEYNALFPPSVEWLISYSPEATWDRSTYANASLATMVKLANEKGYSLVCCNFTGVNAFFVRNDLISNGNFVTPFTAKKHYQSPKYHLIKRFGIRRKVGEFI